MAVIAKFLYEIAPGREADFMRKLQTAADERFVSPVMPSSVRLFRSAVPGPDTRFITLLIEYTDMAAYGARTDFERSNNEWKELFSAQADSPERLISVELLAEV